MSLPAALTTENDVQGNLDADISAGASSFVLQSGQGAKFPAANFAVRIDDEIIYVGSRTTDTCSSLTRAAETVNGAATAAAHTAGTVISLMIPAGLVNGRVARSGDTMTGALIVPSADPPTADGHVTPLSLLKAGARVNESGGVYSVVGDYNVSGIVDNGTGNVTVTLDRDMASVNYWASATTNEGTPHFCSIGTKAAGSYVVEIYDAAGGDTDCGFDTMAAGVMS